MNNGAYIPKLVRTIREVFGQARYAALAGLATLIAFALAVWLPNLKLIAQLINDSQISIGLKVKIPFSFLGSIATNFSFFSASYTIAISLLFGANLALMVFYIRKRKALSRQSNLSSFGGISSGVLGIGCAACGSFILSVLGITGAVALLPLRGAEFGILSVVLLGASIFSLSQKLASPPVCQS